MLLPSRKPRKKSDGIPYWNTVKLKPGGHWFGWRAGPTLGVETHHQFGSRACRGDLTEGALRCPMCEALDWKPGTPRPTRFRGYVPLWDECGVRHVCIISDSYYPRSEEVKLHERCKVTKLLDRGCPLRVDPTSEARLPGLLTAAEREPQDLGPWCLRVWKDEELAEFMTGRAAPSAARGKSTLVCPDVEITFDHDAINDRFAAQVRAGDVGRAAADLLPSLEPKTNGVHKRKSR